MIRCRGFGGSRMQYHIQWVQQWFLSASLAWLQFDLVWRTSQKKKKKSTSIFPVEGWHRKVFILIISVWENNFETHILDSWVETQSHAILHLQVHSTSLQYIHIPYCVLELNHIYTSCRILQLKCIHTLCLSSILSSINNSVLCSTCSDMVIHHILSKCHQGRACLPTGWQEDESICDTEERENEVGSPSESSAYQPRESSPWHLLRHRWRRQRLREDEWPRPLTFRCISSV